MSTALLVIDVQESFTRRTYYSVEGVSEFLVAQNDLIAGAQRLRIPIVRVLHQSPGSEADDPFSATSGLMRPLAGLCDFDAALTVHKTRHSALVGTGLDVWLVERGIRRLIVSGIRTEQCCETTARHASDLGWQVLFVPQATLTWDLPQGDGSVLSVADIRSRTTAVLQARFAQVLSVQEAWQHAQAD